MVLSAFGGLNTDPHAFEALAEYLQKEIEERCRLLARELHDDQYARENPTTKWMKASEALSARLARRLFAGPPA